MEIEQLIAAVQRLAEVGTPILRDCDGVQRLLRRADEVEAHARQIREQAHQLAIILARRVQRNWTPAELQAAGLQDLARAGFDITPR